MAPLESTIKSFPWEDPLAYQLWSAQTYYFVLHSTRLFALASSRCLLTENALHFKLLNHLAEEKGHENLALQDLKAMGSKPSNLSLIHI